VTHSRDTPGERRNEYRRLLGRAVRERTATGIRFWFPAEPGVEEWVRDLAAREKECCPSFGFDITVER
jgi:hypothetical protein